jgi:[ribosomal protein S18]-alanine N-acetyltransferase
LSTVIRSAEEKDLSRIRRIEIASYNDPWPKSIFYLIFRRSPRLFIVAENDCEVFGYAIGEIEENEDKFVGHVVNIAIDNAWKRKGFGLRLLDELEQRFLNHGAYLAYLEVRIGNIPAQSLYSKRGYEFTKLLVNYYRDEDGKRMEKLLKR